MKHAEEVNKVRTDLEEEMSALKTSHEEIVQNLVSECESLRSNWGTEKLELANRIELTASELDQVNILNELLFGFVRTNNPKVVLQ